MTSRTKDRRWGERPETAVPGTGGLVRETSRDLPVASERLFDQAPVFISVHQGPDHTYVYANAPVRAVVPDDQLIGLTLREAVGELIDKALLGRFDEAYRTGEPVAAAEFDVALPGEDGTPRTRWFRQTVQPWRGEDGRVGGVTSFAFEVTEQVEARRRAEESEATLSAVLDSLPVGVIVADADGRITRTNPANEELWGLPPQTDRWQDYGEWKGWWPETGERLEANEWAMARALQSGAVIRDELVETERFGDGERRFMLNNAAPIRDADGEVRGAVIAQLDVTERRRAQLARRDSDARFDAMTDAIPQLIYSIGADGHVDFANERMTLFIGADVVGTDADGWLSLVHEEDREAALASRREGLAGREPFEDEYRLRHRSGSYRWVLDRRAPVLSEDGRLKRWLGTCTDIDDMKKSALHRQLLVAELNHRVKNTLAIVQGFARQSMRGEGDGRTRLAAFEGRLAALAAAHDLLTEEAWEKASLRQVAARVFGACGVDEDRWTADGPRVTLPPKSAVTMAMALHELATNAIKHGALSNEAGRVALDWSVDARRGDFALTWTEAGGPPVQAPTRRGFGSVLVERGLAAEIDGQVTLDYRPDGLVCRIEAPYPFVGD